MTVTAPTQENNSYRTPGTFLPVILERIIEIRWKLLREKHCSSRCCATVACRSLNRWLWVALVFNVQVFAALQDGIISQNLWPPRSPDFDFSGFLSLGLPEEEILQKEKKTSHNRSLERQHPTEHHPHWERCPAANGGQHGMLGSDVSSGGRCSFWTLNVMSPSSSWIRVCFFLVSFHFVYAFRNFRFQRPGRYAWIFLTFLHLCWWRFSLLRCNTLPAMVSFDKTDESTASTLRAKQSKKIDSAWTTWLLRSRQCALLKYR